MLAGHACVAVLTGLVLARAEAAGSWSRVLASWWSRPLTPLHAHRPHPADTGPAAGKSAWEFIPLGTEHMLLGWGHLLFIAGIVLLAGELRRAATLISVFVLCHSTTLIVGPLAGLRVNAVAVDVVIALSVLVVGVVGVIGRPRTGAGSRSPSSASAWCTAWVCPLACRISGCPSTAC